MDTTPTNPSARSGTTTALGSAGRGLATCRKGPSNGEGSKSFATNTTAKAPQAPAAILRQRGDGREPSGKTNAIAVTPAKSRGHAELSQSAAHRAPGNAPGRSSNAYSA